MKSLQKSVQIAIQITTDAQEAAASQEAELAHKEALNELEVAKAEKMLEITATEYQRKVRDN
ncbi:MAG: hypothetical protein WA896_21185 [Spirulinaceae cyanobacterium]